MRLWVDTENTYGGSENTYGGSENLLKSPKPAQNRHNFGWFSLRKSLENDPQNLIFGACGAKKVKKTRF